MKFIVTLEKGCSKGILDPFCKTGNPKAMSNIVIVECDYSTAEMINNLPEVQSIEPDQAGEVCEIQTRETHKNWFLGRICNENHKAPTPNTYKFNRTGKGVDLYLIDTGIRHDHSEFLGRSVTTLYEKKDAPQTRLHGMMCASLIMGNKYGVAPDVNLFSLKTDITASDMVKCYDIILDHHLTKQNDHPSVVSISLGFGSLSYVERVALANLRKAGIIVFAAAGNDNSNIIVSPGRSSFTISVGATNEDDSLASYSNYGPSVDLFAPGHLGYAASHQSPTAIQWATGTSAACPVAASIMALVLEGSHKGTNEGFAIDALSKFFKWNIKEFHAPVKYNKPAGISLFGDVNDSTPRFVFSIVENDPIRSNMSHTPETRYRLIQDSDTAYVGETSESVIRLLDSRVLTQSKVITVTDQSPNKKVRILAGTGFSDVMVAENAIMFTLLSGAKVSVLSANDYTWEVTDQLIGVDPIRSYTFEEFVRFSLGKPGAITSTTSLGPSVVRDVAQYEQGTTTNKFQARPAQPTTTNSKTQPKTSLLSDLVYWVKRWHFKF